MKSISPRRWAQTYAQVKDNPEQRRKFFHHARATLLKSIGKTNAYRGLIHFCLRNRQSGMLHDLFDSETVYTLVEHVRQTPLEPSRLDRYLDNLAQLATGVVDDPQKVAPLAELAEELVLADMDAHGDGAGLALWVAEAARPQVTPLLASRRDGSAFCGQVGSPLSAGLSEGGHVLQLLSPDLIHDAAFLAIVRSARMISRAIFHASKAAGQFGKLTQVMDDEHLGGVSSSAVGRVMDDLIDSFPEIITAGRFFLLEHTLPKYKGQPDQFEEDLPYDDLFEMEQRIQQDYETLWDARAEEDQNPVSSFYPTMPNPQDIPLFLFNPAEIHLALALTTGADSKQTRALVDGFRDGIRHALAQEQDIEIVLTYLQHCMGNAALIDALDDSLMKDFAARSVYHDSGSTALEAGDILCRPPERAPAQWRVHEPAVLRLKSACVDAGLLVAFPGYDLPAWSGSFALVDLQRQSIGVRFSSVTDSDGQTVSPVYMHAPSVCVGVTYPYLKVDKDSKPEGGDAGAPLGEVVEYFTSLAFATRADSRADDFSVPLSTIFALARIGMLGWGAPHRMVLGAVTGGAQDAAKTLDFEPTFAPSHPVISTIYRNYAKVAQWRREKQSAEPAFV